MTLAAIWMTGALVSFSLMAVGARELSGHVDTFLVLFFRSLIGLIIVSLLIIKSGQFRLFRTQRMGLHTLRNVFHFGGQYGWFIGIGLLPLAEVFAIEFTVPLWTLLIACLFLGEKLNVRKVSAITFGFAGVWMIVQPGSDIVNLAAIIVLGAAIGYSVAHATTKSLSSTEHPLTILFLMCLIQFPIGLGMSLSEWQLPSGWQWVWITVVGITALTAHFCITKAMQYAEASVVVTMDFLRLPVIAAVGIVLYSESFETSLILGALLMLCGNLLNLYSPNKSMVKT
ncbi:DMT family transporter [Vibrio coralliilyticus]|uniref:DMT family transporter n=1 Tax=Vibrio coralliilyticus TaxID=190893 RepID=UPI001E551B93|nr:DMT family transporter [Vibrio coralliilyticus]MCC2524704.1 DMT family transporter [Vibrio coralliilyticus]